MKYSGKGGKHHRGDSESEFSSSEASDASEERAGKSRRVRARKTEVFSRPVNFVSSSVPASAATEVSLEEEVDPGQKRFAQLMTSLGTSSAEAAGPSKMNNSDFRGILLAQHQQPQRQQQQQQPPHPAPAPPMPGDMGAWQKHTKGIGLKLLQKFGFTGRLGAKEDGISRPVDVVSRPTGEGLGFTEVKRSKGPDLSTAKDNRPKHAAEASNSNKPSQAATSITKAWKKGKADQSAPKLLDVSDFLGGDGLLAPPRRKQVILDMRGEDVRVLQSMADASSFATDGVGKSDSTGGPKLGQELLYNINVINGLLEAEVSSDSSSYSTESKRMISCRSEISKLEADLKRELPKLERLEHLSKALEKIETKRTVDPASITIEAVVKAMTTLHVAFPEEFQIFGIIQLLGQLINPVVLSIVTGWDPMLDPLRLAEIVVEVSPLVTYFGQQGQSILANQVQLILQATIEQLALPMIRRSIANAWDPVGPENCIVLMTALQKVLPAAVFTSIYDTMIKPKLELAINAWNPETQPPIHSWIHPWFPLFGVELTELFPDIRRKLGQSIKADNVHRKESVSLVSPWLGLLDPTAAHCLLVRSVVPKLVEVVLTLKVQHANDESETVARFKGIFNWFGIVPTLHLVCILEGEFFPNWMFTLSRMLLDQSHDYEQIAEWYLLWKNCLPVQLLESEPRVRAPLGRALELMELTLSQESSLPDPSLELQTSYAEVLAARTKHARFGDQLQNLTTELNRTVAISFKDVVAAFAEENGLVFIPREGRFHDSQQLYSFGSLSVFLRNEVAHAKAHGDQFFRPTSLQDLVVMGK